MKIHALCLVKNEKDVIAQTLRRAAEWCDHIYVMDNGSDDGTWEIVQSLAQELDAVKPFKRDPKPFFDNIRDEILRAHLSLAAPGDWWCILDADEFYIDNPKQFLAEVPRDARAVWPVVYNYLFTDEDLKRYEENPQLYADETPVEERMRFYMVTDYAELRFFRHSARLHGVPVGGYYPVHERRIRFKQYSYRSPRQIAVRLDTRREAMRRGDFIHEKRSNWRPGGVATPGPASLEELPSSWRERVAPAAECVFDDLSGYYTEAPPWTPPRPPDGSALGLAFIPDVRRHAARLLRRAYRRLSGLARRAGEGLKSSRPEV